MIEYYHICSNERCGWWVPTPHLVWKSPCHLCGAPMRCEIIEICGSATAQDMMAARVKRGKDENRYKRLPKGIN